MLLKNKNHIYKKAINKNEKTKKEKKKTSKKNLSIFVTNGNF